MPLLVVSKISQISVFLGNNNKNNNEIILKQADIIKDCQERLRFERSLRLQAEARLKLAVEKGRITVNIN